MLKCNCNNRSLTVLLISIFLISGQLLGATFTVINSTDSGPGSLRDAILQANANPGKDLIPFNIPGAGPHTILPLSQLPPITDPAGVSMSGFTQPGAVSATPPSALILMIEIDGANAGGAHGLWLQCDSNLIMGICINNFEQDGFRIEGGLANPTASNNNIQQCFIGTDITGTSIKGNGRNQASLWAGVSIQNVSGGTAIQNVILHSLISGNYAEGVHIIGPIQPGQVQMNSVGDCYIGTDLTGFVDLGNLHEGVCLSEGTLYNLIYNNLISGNDYDGVGIQGFDNLDYMAPPIQTDFNNVTDNIIGLDVAGSPLGNSMHGVAIGEYGPSQWGCAANNDVVGNTIAENGGDGVAVWEHSVDFINADYNKISANNIFQNNGLGIDLQNNGVTPNDGGDPDEGPNIYINFPVISTAAFISGTTTITGTLDINTNPAQALVEIFFVSTSDPTGYGEGDTYLGSATPDGVGNWTFVTTSLLASDNISATATDVMNNTSEFALVYVVTGQAVTGACCLGNGGCGDLTQANCIAQGGLYQGDGTACLGDNNSNYIDDACEGFDQVDCEPQGGQNPTHPNTYWYDVTPGGTLIGRCDFHIEVFDSLIGNYSNWVEPAGWSHQLHQISASHWVVSWWTPNCANPIITKSRFGFDNNNPSVWGDWVTTKSGTSVFYSGTPGYWVDGQANHSAQADGYGYHIHTPEYVEQVIDTCDYYKSPYDDYAPNGMPDFDQKQNSWYDPQTLDWTHCGPVALANCFWWFDSKFETGGVLPPTYSDNYPLVQSYGGSPWDDHDPNNVIPFIDSLAKYSNTNPVGSPFRGTNINDLANGAWSWLVKAGLAEQYTVEVIPIDGGAYDFERLRQDVLISQDVILLLGFWQEEQPGVCGDRIGGHYVTVAGTCTDPSDSAICISDPFYDMNEGEPPAGSAHASNIHNDATNVSGPHGTINHDKYYVDYLQCFQGIDPQFTLKLRNYPVIPADAGLFFGQNSYSNDAPSAPTGAPIVTIVEWALVICPVEDDTCALQIPGDVDGSGIIDTNDVVYLSTHLYGGGPGPTPLANGDVDGNCTIDLRDIICLSLYLATGDICRVDCTCVNPNQSNPNLCCYGFTGNIDYDLLNSVDITDLLFLVDYMFLLPGSAPAPPCMEEANVDGSASNIPDISDLLYLVDYMFLPPGSAPAPVICPY